MSNIVYFSGVGTGGDASQSVTLPSLADRYIPLDLINPTSKQQAFMLWLGIIYLNRSDACRFVKGVKAEDDPMIVWEFNEDYKAGAWRKLGRGLTLEESVLVLERSTGEEFWCLVNSAFPLQPMERIKHKLILGPDAILDLAVVYFRPKGRFGHRPWPTLYYDGRTGHSISLFWANWEGTRFAYVDPWPGRSLLCEENNVAGIKALLLGHGKAHLPKGRAVDVKYWGVTREELSRVLYSIILPDTAWFELEEVLRVGTANQTFEGLSQQSFQELVVAMSNSVESSPDRPRSGT